ncbi:MAG: adenylate/guanylate cyclase domain-containing protein [Acidimicrobiales bacterium]
MRTDPGTLQREVPGTVAFVDISGFTKLSERLASHGKVGAEELSETINRCFVDLLAVAYAHGGGLIKFGGDALLLLFTGVDHEARACRAAVGMRRTLRDVGRVTVLGHQVTLRMSVGVHSGVFNFFLVGESHRELVVTGPAASTTVLMEGTAEAGEIVVSHTTAAALQPSVLGAAKGDGVLLRRAPPGISASPAPLEPVSPAVDLAGCVSTAVRGGLLAGVQQPEHRRVTVAFVHFDGTDAIVESSGPDKLAALLDTLVAGVQRSADRQGVAFLGTDIDRDGGKIILTAGAPSTTGQDEHRMLLVLRETMDLRQDVALRIGVNRGSVFAGDIGPHYRRTFTVMGDTVNLAARLMAKAVPGQILATPEVLDQAGADVDTTELEPFMVKGKAQPVRALSVGTVAKARRVRDADGLPFVGRHTELAHMRQAVAGVQGGTGTLLQITGEPGVGKSRLVEELQSMAAAFAHARASCEPYESSTPYHPFRVLLRSLLQLTPDTDDEQAAARLRLATERDAPGLVPWLPLIASVLDVPFPDTPETAQLDEQFRRPRLAAVTTELLGVLIGIPLLLVVEDAHWMDEASADILRHMANAVGSQPWLVCVTRRAESTGFDAPRQDAVVLLDLLPLDGQDAAELIHLATQDAPITAHAMAALAERSGGNPLFLRELVASTRDAKDLAALPDSVEAVIAARIDQLHPADRNLLRRASVLGRSFPPALLDAVIDAVPGTGDGAWLRLAEFLERRGDMVSFAHALVRDSAYDGLPYRLRQELHARTGDSIRAMAGTGADEQAALLSLHYFHAHRYDEAWEFSLTAAERARAVYANVEAAEFYERALDAARHVDGLGPGDVARIREELGDAQNNAGAYQAAEAAYRAARRQVHEPVDQARLLLKLARVMGWLDRYSAAMRWITRGIRTVEGVQGPDASAQRAQLLAWYGRFCQEAGQHARAIKWCTAAADEAQAAGERDALANALKVLDWANMDLGRLDEPVNWTRALALFEELGDLTGQASVLNLLGGLAYWRGDWTQALDLYRRAQSMVRRTGNSVIAAFYVNNIGEISLEQGRLAEAGELFAEASRIWRAAGYRSGAASVRCLLGRVACGEGRYDDAMLLFEESLQESQGVGGQVEVLDTRSRMAECQLLAGRTQQALAIAEGALEQARALGGYASQSPLLFRVQGAALLRSGDVEGARRALEQSLHVAGEREADYERALTLRVMSRLDERTGRRDHADAVADSDAILDRLGVVWTPELV